MTANPQESIFAAFSQCHRHMEYQLLPEASAADLRPLLQAVNSRDGIVIGFGHRAWQQLGQTPPTELIPFKDIGAARSTQADIWLWISHNSHSEALDQALALNDLLAPHAKLLREIDGQQYHQSRDLSGFEDGSGNPKTDAAQRAAALIADGPNTAGSYVLTQQWQHKLQAFKALPLAEQEGIIGRTKADAIELQGEAMPASSHVSRTDLKVDGVAQKVWRRSVPWGGAEKNGLYFVGFACELSRLQLQLESMFGLYESGVKDRLTEFSSPLSSSWWYAPSREQLAAL